MRHRCPEPKRHAHGFTLIEILASIVIVGLLAAIALPNFMQQIHKGRRSEAITEIQRASQAQERVRASAATYSANVGTGAGNLALTPAAVTPTTSGSISSSSYATAGALYRISVSTDTSGTPPANTVGYVITATAINSATGDHDCRTLSMTVAAQGVISYASSNAADTPNAGAANLRCWNRG